VTILPTIVRFKVERKVISQGGTGGRGKTDGVLRPIIKILVGTGEKRGGVAEGKRRGVAPGGRRSERGEGGGLMNNNGKEVDRIENCREKDLFIRIIFNKGTEGWNHRVYRRAMRGKVVRKE